MSITSNVEHIRERIQNAEQRSGRAPGSVRLMVAAKYQSRENLNEAARAGVTAFGHNIVQQLITAVTQLNEDGYTGLLHTVIGPLQSNKIRHAMDHAARIDTVDSFQLAQRIARRQQARIDEGVAEGPYPILLQVNSADAASQSGCAPKELIELAEQIRTLPLLRIEGLMTIGANTDDEARIRRSFATTRELSERLRALPDLAHATELSMGMTNDMEIAIEEGATLVRVGRAIFGERPRP